MIPVQFATLSRSGHVWTMASALLAMLGLETTGAMAQTPTFVGIGQLGNCTTVAVCSDATSENCAETSKPQRMFSVQLWPSDGHRIWQFWVETSYSRFPESDVNEEIDFLPLNWLPTDGWRARILALAEGRQTIAGTTSALWGRTYTEQGLIVLNLYQFNPRGLVKRWNVHCQMDDL